jgi:hypothetical protein
MRSYLAVIFVAVAILIGAVIVGTAYNYKFRSHNTISIVGNADTNFTADLVIWSASYQRTAWDIKDAYNYLKYDQNLIQQYLTNHGLNSSEIVFSSINIEKQFSQAYNADGKQTGQTFQGYKLTQNVKVESGKVDSVEKISRDITELLQNDMELTSEEPLYYYTKLSDLKIDLLAKASNDAYNRANTIASNSHCKLGTLRKSTSGIFQITGEHSNEAYTYSGAFNTSSKHKTATVTVRSEYQLKDGVVASPSR